MKQRYDFLTEMIQEHGYKIGAEVGTGTGRNAMEILRANPELHLVEVAYYPGPKILPKDEVMYCTCQRAKELFLRRMGRKKFKDRITILPLPSHKAVKKVKDGTLDFVFIDADHTYEECLQDIQIWFPKVRKGGLVSGHDYGDERFPGVAKAVHEFFGEDNIKTAPDGVWYLWKT